MFKDIRNTLLILQSLILTIIVAAGLFWMNGQEETIEIAKKEIMENIGDLSQRVEKLEARVTESEDTILASIQHTCKKCCDK